MSRAHAPSEHQQAAPDVDTAEQAVVDPSMQADFAQQALGELGVQPGLRNATATPSFRDQSLGEIPSVIGQTPQDAVRAMGPAFGTDFATVRVHQTGRADAMGVHAFTQGEDIHLAAGRGDPATTEGKQLLGHELAHVVQQRQSRVAGAQASGAAVNADESLEREADAAGAAVAQGASAPDGTRDSGRSGAALAAGPIQCFGAVEEHKRAGDEGSGQREYVWSSQGDVDEASAPLPTKRTKRVGPDGLPEMCAPQQFEFRGDVPSTVESRWRSG
ncbi:MAG: DUF4157 domain-containing protein [Myxococcota bacterium]|nr:DUF4157 domain-containing protein [Myxococcota bacterium]